MRIINGKIIAILLSIVFLFSCASKSKNYILEKKPAWFKDYLDQNFADIQMIMKEGFTRLEAFEIQNRARAFSDKNKSVCFADALKQAIKSYKKGEIGDSGYASIKSFKNTDFIVVFDLDETLLAQWYRSYTKGEKYFDFCTGISDITGDNGLRSTDCIKMTPGWDRALKEIRSTEGFRGFLVYTGKPDSVSMAIFNKVDFNGRPLKDEFMGVFTRGHLTRGKDAVLASKDLRIIDESLEHVIILDDNSTRLFQPKNVKVFPKFNADKYLEAKNESFNKELTKYYENIFDVISNEIKESAEYAKNHDIPFVKAFYPYSQAGSFCARMVQDILGYSKKSAADFLRANPTLCEPEFYGTKPTENKSN